jgi:hypothetical protein
VQLRNTRQGRRGGAPAPRHVNEVPLPVEEKPRESKEKNVVGEIGVGVVDLEPIIKFQQLNQTIWTSIKFIIKRDKRKDRDIQLSSPIIQGVNIIPLNDFMKLAPSTFIGMDNLENPQKFLDDI